MPTPFFEAGNQAASGGARPGAGRPTETKRAIKRQAAEIAKSYIEKHVKPVLATYLDLAKGRTVNRRNQITGELYQSFEIDPPTTRHYIDKLVAPAKQEIELSGTFRIIKVNSFEPDAIDVTPDKPELDKPG